MGFLYKITFSMTMIMISLMVSDANLVLNETVSFASYDLPYNTYGQDEPSSRYNFYLISPLFLSGSNKCQVNTATLDKILNSPVNQGKKVAWVVEEKEILKQCAYFSDSFLQFPEGTQGVLVLFEQDSFPYKKTQNDVITYRRFPWVAQLTHGSEAKQIRQMFVSLQELQELAAGEHAMIQMEMTKRPNPFVELAYSVRFIAFIWAVVCFYILGFLYSMYQIILMLKVGFSLNARSTVFIGAAYLSASHIIFLAMDPYSNYRRVDKTFASFFNFGGYAVGYAAYTWMLLAWLRASRKIDQYSKMFTLCLKYYNYFCVLFFLFVSILLIIRSAVHSSVFYQVTSVFFFSISFIIIIQSLIFIYCGARIYINLTKATLNSSDQILKKVTLLMIGTIVSFLLFALFLGMNAFIEEINLYLITLIIQHLGLFIVFLCVFVSLGEFEGITTKTRSNSISTSKGKGEKDKTENANDSSTIELGKKVYSIHELQEEH